jgi:hypothetical protein
VQPLEKAVRGRRGHAAHPTGAHGVNPRGEPTFG